jgi:hypothetical protein
VTEHRKLMERALRELLFPELRRRGFKGSLPHFRRVTPNRVDYLSVQFSSSGGRFVVEVASAGPDGKPEHYGKHLPIEKLNVTYFARRLRLGSNLQAGEADHWFEFGPASYETTTQVPPFENFRRIAAEATSYLETQMESWLADPSPNSP